MLMPRDRHSPLLTLLDFMDLLQWDLPQWLLFLKAEQQIVKQKVETEAHNDHTSLHTCVCVWLPSSKSRTCRMRVGSVASLRFDIGPY